MKKNTFYLLLYFILSCASGNAQRITFYAGQGIPYGYSGDGGSATSAELNVPIGTAMDGSGNLFFSDHSNYRIREISSGTINSIAGNGTNSTTGNGGAATAATISNVYNIAIDGSNNIYFTDYNSNTIRKIDNSGNISLFAGGGSSNSEGVAATSANLGEPVGIAIDNNGDIYVGSITRHKVLKINHTANTVTTYAGGGTGGYAGDGNPATASAVEIYQPYGLYFDASNNLYIVDKTEMVVRKVAYSATGSGLISTFAGNGTSGFAGDGGAASATTTELATPASIIFDASGNAYIGDMYNFVIRMVNPAGTISTFAGEHGSNGFDTGSGSGTSHKIYEVNSMLFDSNGNLYAANGRGAILEFHNGTPVFAAGTSQSLNVCENSSGNSINSMMAITENDYWAGQTETWSIISGPSHGSLSGFPATATSTGGALTPSGLSYSPTSSYIGTDAFTIQISDGYLSSITTVNVVVGNAGTIAGSTDVCIGANVCLSTSGLTGGTWTSSNAANATVNSSTGVVTGVGAGRATISYAVTCPSTTFYATATVTASVCGITTFAGTGSGGYSGDGGAATAAELYYPSATAIDQSGNIYIADLNYVVRKVNSSGTITTIAGNGSSTYSGDGGAATAAGMYPISLAVDASGNIFVGDKSFRIREINTSGVISTIAGTGTNGYTGDGGSATAAEISVPAGITFDNNGNLLFSDNNNNVVRKIDLSGVISTIAGIGSGGYAGDGGQATAAKLFKPSGISVDYSNNIYIGDVANSVVRKINSTGVISTFAGIAGSIGYTGDGGLATAASLKGGNFLATDCSGNLYICDATNTIRYVNSSGIINTVAGNGIQGYTGDGGPATTAELFYGSLTLSPSEDIYIACGYQNVVREIGPNLCRTCRNTIGGNDATQNQFSHYLLFPNPTTGELAIQQNVVENGNASVKIANLLGQLVLERNISFVDGKSRFTVDNLSTGIYNVEISGGNGVPENFKLVLEH